MSGNEKRRQKSLQRKAAKRKQKKRALSRQSETVPATPRAALRAAARWPLYECLISRDWNVEGELTQILVARSPGPGEIAVAVVLVDLGCLGVKDAFARLVTVDEYEELRERISEMQPLVRTDLNLAAKVIREGIRFARSLGFEPHRDYADAAILLADADPDTSSAEVPLGMDGKPFFVAGPHDNVPKIMAQLQRAAGAGNYEYVVPIGGPEDFDEEDFDEGDFDDEELLEGDTLALPSGATRIAGSSSLTQQALPAPREAVDAQHRLATLEKQADLVIEGAVRSLSVQVAESELGEQPAVAFWLDAQTGLVRSYRVFAPDTTADEEVAQVVDALVDALASPLNTSLGQPALPARVRVDDPALADAVGDLLEPLGAEVELASSLPLVDEAAESFESYMERPDEDAPFAWDVDPALLPPLYEAAAAYLHHSPWDYLTDYPPIAVALGQAGPQMNVRTLYGCVLGAAGMVRGIAFYYSLGALERVLEQSQAVQEEGEDDEDLEKTLGASMEELTEELRRTGVPVDDLPPELIHAALSDLAAAVKDGAGAIMEDALVLDFEGTEADDPTYVEWLRERNLPLFSVDMLPTFTRTRRNEEPRLPNDREVRAFTLALEAVNGFVSEFRERLAAPAVTWEPLQAEVKVSGGRSVKVRWPGDD